MNKTQIAKYVVQAKRMMKQRDSLRYEIAKISYLVAPDIGRGTKVPPGAYTQKLFAKDIGIDPVTLRNWRNDYKRVYSKLPKAQQKGVSWRAIQATKKATTVTSSASAVRAAYKKSLEEPEEKRCADKIIGYLSLAKSNIMFKLSKSKPTKTELNRIQKILNEINQELSGSALLKRKKILSSKRKLVKKTMGRLTKSA